MGWLQIKSMYMTCIKKEEKNHFPMALTMFACK